LYADERHIIFHLGLAQAEVNILLQLDGSIWRHPPAEHGDLRIQASF